ncbi:MAG: DMT family transporter [Devosiaceae bacterium]|nr:DMT family transporter [Devosiaceae bacterium MH13]
MTSAANTPLEAPIRADNVPLAVMVIVGAIFAMSAGDAVIKALGANVSLGIWQIFAVRSVIAIPIVVGLAAVTGGIATLAPRAAGWITLRSMLLTGVWLAYYASLPVLPLSVAAAGLYTLPLFITGFAAIWTDDRVTWVHGIAAAIGFAGVALVLRPGGEAFSLYALLPVLGAMLFGLAMTVSRVKCQSENPLALVLNLHIVFVTVGTLGLVAFAALPSLERGGFLLSGWTAPSGDDWWLVGLLTASILAASIGTAIAYQRAPIAIVGTFEFAYVGFASLWGILFFAEVLDLVTVIGLIMIYAAGVLTVRAKA